MPFNPVNPVSVGLASKKDHYDRVFENTVALKAGAATNGVHDLFVPAAGIRPHDSGGCGPLENLLLSAGRYLPGLPFDGTSIESASFTLRLPKKWNEGTVTFVPLLTNTAGGAGAVVMQLASIAASDNDTLDAAVGTFVTSTDTVLVAKNLMVAPESGGITIAGTPAAGDLVRFVVQRDPTAAGDTYASDIYLLGLVIRVTVDAPTDD